MTFVQKQGWNTPWLFQSDRAFPWHRSDADEALVCTEQTEEEQLLWNDENFSSFSEREPELPLCSR